MKRKSYYFGFRIIYNRRKRSNIWTRYKLLLKSYKLSPISLKVIPDMVGVLTSDLTLNFNETFYLYFGLPLYYERLFNRLFESSFMYFVSDLCRFQRLKRRLVWYNFRNDNYFVELDSLDMFYYKGLDFDDVESDIYLYLQNLFVFWGPLEIFYSKISSFRSFYLGYNLLLVLAQYFYLYRFVTNKVWSPWNVFGEFLFRFVFVKNRKKKKFDRLLDFYFKYKRDLTFYVLFRFWILPKMFPLVLFNLCIDVIFTWLCMRVDALLKFFYSLFTR